MNLRLKAAAAAFLPCLFLMLTPLQGGGAELFKNLVTPSLLADTTAIVPGKPFTVAVRLKLKPGWHIYWEFAGDGGRAPTVEWTLPPGFSAGKPQWPTPKQRIDDPDLVSYVYEEEAALLVAITPPAALAAAQVDLHARLTWDVCEKTCVPGEAAIALTLPVAAQPQAANEELFHKWRDLLPKSPPPFAVEWDLHASDKVTARISGAPAGEKLEFYPLPPGDSMPDHPKMSPPDPSGARTVTMSLGEGGAGNAPWRALVVEQKSDGTRQGWLSTAKISSSPAGALPTAGGPSADGPGKPRFLPMLFFAFVGGLILNVMPCVLPVIALKIFGFVRQAGEDPRRVFRLGLSFAAGVYAFFFAVALAVIALKAAGSSFNWGFQFQNRFVFAGLISLVFVFGLNLLGVFEVTLGSATTSTLSTLSNREGCGGAFLHGVFTTLLGASCTAPFLSASLGYAATQTPATVFAIFTAIACGMSLPYLLLTAHPAWMRYLPKPGVWMERAKQVTGFIMLAVAVWLLGVFTVSRPAAAAGLLYFLFTLAVAAWILGVVSRRTLGAFLAAAIAIGSYFLFLKPALQAASTAPASAAGIRDGWAPFSAAEVAEGVKRGQPVLVDYTADWCINCKVFERTVLASDAVREALRHKNVLTLRADWTNGDQRITQSLHDFGRVGVPLYVLYTPGEKEPRVMDALTTQGFLERLKEIKE